MTTRPTDSGAAAKRHAAEIGEGEGEVTSSPGPATSRTAPATRRSTGSPDFEKETGCEVNVKTGNTSDEMVQLMRTGQYDGVSASGDATIA